MSTYEITWIYTAPAEAAFLPPSGEAYLLPWIGPVEITGDMVATGYVDMIPPGMFNLRTLETASYHESPSVFSMWGLYPVPEPGLTFALMIGTAFLGMLSRFRRRQLRGQSPPA